MTRPGRATLDELIAIWRDLLDTAAVGPDDDFYDLGGYSLFTLRLLGRVAAAFGVGITLDDVFTYPTPASLADRIDALRVRPVDVIVGLWRVVLRTGDVTAEDDFFDLGGNSIIAIRLLPLIKAHLGVEATISMILDHPTPRELADALTTFRPAPMS
jgi:acyl carrier protein